MQFLISAEYRYPQKHSLQKVAAAGRCRIFGDADPPHGQPDDDAAGQRAQRRTYQRPGGAVGAAP
jgi:hypothetical protein